MFRPTALLAQAIDLICVLAFVIIGRVSHREALSLVGILVTLWPFLVGLVLGWVITRSWRTPFRILWNGVAIVIITVIVGMVLRLVSGQGAPVSFAAVALGVLAVLLLGWRGIALLLTHKRRATK
jgi:hypothetical protein